MEAFVNIFSGLTYEDIDQIQQYIEQALAVINNYERPIKAGETVAIKVNIVGPYLPEQAACTHPAIVKALVEALKKTGARILLVEDCYDDDAPQISGILDVARDSGVEFINTRDGPFCNIKVGEHSYEFSEAVLKADHLILVPKLKTHVFTYYTGAVKLLYGSIPKMQRVRFHRFFDVDKFSAVLVDIFSIKKPALVVMDAITSMEAAGPTHGNPVNTGLLLVSNDAVALDYHASRMIGYDPMAIDTTRIALERGLCTSEPEKAVVSACKPIQPIDGFTVIPIMQGTLKQRYVKGILGVPLFDADKCVKCEVCVESCPFEAITMEEFPVINPKRCHSCLCCIELCVKGAFSSRMNKNKTK